MHQRPAGRRRPSPRATGERAVSPDPESARSRFTARHASVAALVVALLIAIGGSVAAWTAERRVAGEWGFPLDDTWIHVQIARNVATGHGWSFNPDIPVQNSSGPLWTALLASGFVVFGDSLWFAKVAGLACLLGIVLFVWRLTRLLTADDWAAACAALLAGMSAVLARHALTAMETSLAALLVIAAMDSFYRWPAGRRRFAWSVLAGLAVATRPEALVLIPMLAAERWWRGSGSGSRDVLLQVAVAGLVLVPYFALNVAISGSLFPTTFGAKAGPTGLAHALRHLDFREVFVSLTLYPYVWSTHALMFWSRSNIGLLLAAPIGAIAIARGPHRAITPVLFLVAFAALRGIVAPHQTPWVHYGRYISSVAPLLMMMAGVGIVTLLRRAPRMTVDARRLRFFAAAATALGIAALVVMELRLPDGGPGVLGSLRYMLPGAKGMGTAGMQAFLVNEWLGPAALVIVGAFTLGLTYARARMLLPIGIGLGSFIFILQGMHARFTADAHARAVRSITKMDVELGRWVKRNIPAGMLVTVNDIGAIAYFGERPVVDAIGLATPEIVPYMAPRRLRNLVGLRRMQTPYVMVFPNWFPEWSALPSLLEPLMIHSVPDPGPLGSGSTVIYRAHWDRFARYYTDELLEKLDPRDIEPTIAAHWRRGLRNLGQASRAELYCQVGIAARRAEDWAEAERAFQRATQLEPSAADGWKGLSEVYLAQGNSSRLRSTLQECVRAMPSSPTACEALADLVAPSGDLAAADQLYRQALALQPDNVRLLRKVAMSYARHGDNARAADLEARAGELAVRMPARELVPLPAP